MAKMREKPKRGIEALPQNTKELQAKPTKTEALSDAEEPEKLLLEFQRQREFLQSANEELATTEEKLRIQNEELISAQEELENVRARYQNLFETVPDGYVITDPKGIIEEFNSKAAVLCRRTNSDLKGQSISSLLPDTEIARIISDLNSGVGFISKKTKIIFPECNLLWADVTAALSHDKSGTITGFRWLIRDITARKKAEEALQESEERLRLFIDYAPAALAMFDREMKYLAVSERWLRDYRLEGQNVIGRTHYDVFPEIPEHWREIHRRCLAGEVLYSEEDPFKRLDDSVQWLQWEIRPWHEASGRIGGIVMFTIDITERKSLETELKQYRERLETRVEERTRELSHMASELTFAEQRERQRLAQILHDGLQQILVGAKFRLALAARSGGKPDMFDQLTDLIDEAIGTSRSLSVELSPPILIQGDLCSSLEWLANWMYDKHGLNVRLIIRSRIEKVQQGILLLLFQAARELLFNTVKHSGVNSAVIEVDKIGNSVVVNVADEGGGFDPNQLCFEGGRGSGLGLFGIRERLFYVGGKFEVYSAPGRGTHFRMTAPIAESELSSIPRKDQKATAHSDLDQLKPASVERKTQIMLVDDHKVMRQGLAGLISSEPDLEIAGEASDGESAVELVRELGPDVILMDIGLPGIDGIQATQIIHHEFPDIRIIGLSMHEESEKARAMINAGAVKYLTKSGPAAELIKAIREDARISM